MPQRQPRYSKGQRIGNRFLVHQALMGGMGEVYLCLDEQQMIPFALKTFQGSSPDLADIFKGEVAKWIALEKHPNIVRCFYMEKFDNIPFMALEWVAGEEGRGTDLRSWLRRGPLDLPLALRFTIDIVRGLIHANDKSPGIVHRDLKPDNVLVNQSRQAKITDFGLTTVAQLSKVAADVQDEADMGQSRYMGNIVGTPAYMPPEQWRGDRDIDFRADMYAVGCILYELLTGRWLYDAQTVSELRGHHLEAAIPALNGSLPSELRLILEGCLAKRREERFARLDLLLQDLTQLYATHSDDPLPEVEAEAFTAIDYNNRGATFSNLGQHERAIADFDVTLRLKPTLATAYYNRGNCHTNLGQHERAITDFDAALRFNPTLVAAYVNRGNSYVALGQHERATADFDRAIALDPTLVAAYYNRGISYANREQHERAIRDFDRTIDLDPTFAPAYLNRGNSYGDLGQDERAIADYDRALTLDPTLVAAYYNRGNHYANLGQPERAIADYNAAIRLDPNHVLAHYNRGISYANREQDERAIIDFDAALRLDPTLTQAYFNRGCSYAKLGHYKYALSDFDVALHLDPNLAGAYYSKGAVFANSDRLQEALPLLEKANDLGHPQAAGAVSQVRQMLAMPPSPTQSAPNDSEAALEVFLQAWSLETMRQAVVQFPILAQMIPAIKQVNQEQIPPELKLEFEQRLAWLRQIVGGK